MHEEPQTFYCIRGCGSKITISDAGLFITFGHPERLPPGTEWSFEIDRHIKAEEFICPICKETTQ